MMRKTEAQLKANRDWSDRNQLVVIRAKSVPCADCGRVYPFYVMEFDHVRGEKAFNIGGAKVSRKRLLDEIAKCDVVCSNCHRERTWKNKWSAISRHSSVDRVAVS